MNDLEMIDKIKLMHQQMKEICLAAGIGKGRYKKLLGKLKNLVHQDLEKRFNFLVQMNKPYQEFKRIWDQHTKEEWEQLRILVGTSLREQKALKVAKEELRKYWDENFTKAIS